MSGYQLHLLDRAGSVLYRSNLGVPDAGTAMCVADALCAACSDVCEAHEVWNEAGRVGMATAPSMPNPSDLNGCVQQIVIDREIAIRDSRARIADSRRLLGEIAAWTAQLPGTFRNRLLAAMPAPAIARLKPYLEAVALPARLRLEGPYRTAEHLYFFEEGFASVVAENSGRAPVEVGLVGREGMTGLALVLGDGRPLQSTHVRMAGNGHRIAAGALRAAMRDTPAVNDHIMRYAYLFLLQTKQAVIANATASLEERLARWILMAHDRVGQDSLPLTHELLALAIGTRRPGVTEAIHALGARGAVATARGLITVTGRAELENAAGPFYGAAEHEYERLLGAMPHAPVRTRIPARSSARLDMRDERDPAD